KSVAGKGFKLYALKLHGPYAAPDQSPIDALTKVGNGVSLDADGAELMQAKPRNPIEASRPAAWNGYGNNLTPVGRRVLTTILVDAINPQFADRVEPMVAVLWELLQEPGL